MSRSRRLAAAVGMALVVGLALPAGASSDSAVPWTSFSESTTCGRPYVATPIASRIGSLSESERIFGPLGRQLGRSVGEVRSALVDWVVPMSGGRTARVHRAALPAFQQVSANLAVAAAQGLWYPVTSGVAFNPRTIGGEYQLSRHALGISIDINPAANPYSPRPDRLVTDMPPWYLQAWRDAGFCWGGDWAFSKDPMHFSWMGPAPGSGGLPVLPALGAVLPHAAADTFATGWAGRVVAGRMGLADMTGSGAVDVLRFRDHPAGVVVDVMSARSAFERCSLSRWMVPGLEIDHGLVALGDLNGDSRTDLVSVSPDGSLAVSYRDAEFAPAEYRDIAVPAGLRAVVVADHDGDRRGDLHLLGADGSLTVLAGPEFSQILMAQQLPVSAVWIAAADRTGDGRVELYAVDQSGTVSVLERGGDGVSAVTETSTIDVQGAVTVSAADIDGDHRADLAVLAGDASLRVSIGNTSTGRPTSGWWKDPGYECPDNPLPLEWRGTFFDDDASGFEDAIERVAAAGVTVGCNPPFADAYCPDRVVTRAEMATFLVRGFGLAPPTADPFTDDDGSYHEQDIGALAAAGITLGCGRGAFCPHAPVTRGEMAAFLTRAAGLAPSGTDPFSDTEGHRFEAEISSLQAAGITLGCGPGLYCPDAPVTRAEMAMFLTRALGL
ncbi:MAG: S-layer homology domain-containing protein [Acidimicrobiia bacterium]